MSVQNIMARHMLVQWQFFTPDQLRVLKLTFCLSECQGAGEEEDVTQIDGKVKT